MPSFGERVETRARTASGDPEGDLGGHEDQPALSRRPRAERVQASSRGVFNKGFVRAFAQYIGVDAEAMVDAYLEELREQESKAESREGERGRRGVSRSRPGHEPSISGRDVSGKGASRLIVGLVAVALLRRLGVIGWAAWRHFARTAAGGARRGRSGGARSRCGAADRPANGTATPPAVGPAPRRHRPERRSSASSSTGRSEGA